MWVPITDKTLNVRGFFKRGIYEKSASIFFRENNFGKASIIIASI